MKKSLCSQYVCALEHKTCDILAAERLRLMRFDNRLIVESLKVVCCPREKNRNQDILTAERLRLMRFDNRLIIDSFQEAVCLLKW